MRPALQHVTTGVVYPVISVDEVNKVITLQGTHGPFNEPYDVDRFTQMGYKRVRVEDEPAPAEGEGDAE